MSKLRRLNLYSGLLFAMTVSAGLGACAEQKAPRFPHQSHLAGVACGAQGQPECLTCNSCHAVSQRDRAHKLPDGQLCAGCHRGDAHALKGVLQTEPERVSGKIRFDHDQHLEMKALQGQCVPCHAGIVAPDRPALPPMKECFSCHEHEEQWNAGVCAPCHGRADLEKTLPQTFLRHDKGFVSHHGALAEQEAKLCQSCHSQAQCADCHDVTQDLSVERRQPERIERSFVHRGDFMVRHSIEAQEDPARCARCHTPATCDSCHLERGVSGNGLAGRSPHPSGWVGTNTTSKSFHGRAARRDILSCASCHDQGPATNCIRCHKVGGYGGNPHPSGWKSLQSESSGMCRYCHE